MDNNKPTAPTEPVDELYETDIDFDQVQEDGERNRRSVDISSGTGDESQRMTNAFMGYNHRMTSLSMAKNREQAYLTFFTRPNLNLSVDNLKVSRRLSDKARSEFNSANMAIVAALDPINALTADDPNHIQLGGPLKNGVPFDNKQAFIPILTNTLQSISGFPDNTLDIFTSNEGIRREQFSMVDSCYNINNTFSLSATFRNIDGDPITALFSTWLEYMAGVYVGDMLPSASSIVQNEIDYQTRIYRFNTDPSMRYVTKLGIANACFPTNDNLGAAMNVDMTNPFITDNDSININFHCVGAEYQDPIIIEEFNNVVATFNTDMRPLNSSVFIPTSPELIPLQPSEALFFNYYGYPHISVATREITWYVYQSVYNEISNKVLLDK